MSVLRPRIEIRPAWWFWGFGKTLFTVNRLTSLSMTVFNNASQFLSPNLDTFMLVFFTADDGQHIYLHSLNARCLVKEYGGLEHCPQKITATIVDKESVFVTEVMISYCSRENKIFPKVWIWYEAKLLKMCLNIEHIQNVDFWSGLHWTRE